MAQQQEQPHGPVMEDGKTVMVTLTNSGYLLYTLNMLKSLEAVAGKETAQCVWNVCMDPVSVTVLRHAGYHALLLQELDATVEDTAATLGKFCPWNTKGYDRICYYKLKTIYELLRQGRNVLLMDGDIVFLKDPRVDMREWWMDSEYEVWCQNDAEGDYQTRNMCTGYMYIRSNPRMIALYDCVSELGLAKYQQCAFDNNDQTYFNRYVKPACRMRALPLALYPNGGYFYADPVNRRKNAILIHFNWVKGHEKMAKMKQHRAWMLTEEDEAPAGGDTREAR